MDTIFAVSSGAPPAAIAVLRISGPAAFAAGTALTGRLPPDRSAALRALRDPVDGALLDRALILVFSAPHTATGEDLVELHLHGGRAIVAAVTGVLEAIPGLRAAEPGEFTRRALLAGRIDLTEAEGLGDLLAAETEAQRKAALLVAEGGIRARIATWSTRVLALSARIEAGMDFAEEDDLDPIDMTEIAQEADALACEMQALAGAPPVERLRDGVRIVLAGPPNSGKSTLLNAMVDREAAIVSPIAGTTRDRIEIPVQRNGIAYLIVDTAGLADSTADPIEQVGIERARTAIDTADLVVWLGDDPAPAGALAVHARCDLPGRERPETSTLAISAKTGAGLGALWSTIEFRSRPLLPVEGEVALNERQRSLAQSAAAHLAAAAKQVDPLLFAEELRITRSTLHRITGASHTEEMLDALFGKFCIGK